MVCCWVQVLLSVWDRWDGEMDSRQRDEMEREGRLIRGKKGWMVGWMSLSGDKRKGTGRDDHRKVILWVNKGWKDISPTGCV